jgi:hypothetical protein
MAYERKPGDIAIFRDYKKKNERAPDWTGSFLDENGVEFKVALWEKGQSKTMLAGRIEKARPPEARGYPIQNMVDVRRAPPKVAEKEFDDEIPF